MNKSAIIISDNTYLVLGLKNIIISSLSMEIETCSQGINAVANIGDYDYIFLEVAFNQTGLCMSNLTKRKSKSHIFFIQKGISRIKNNDFLPCFIDAMILHKDMSLSVVSQMIKNPAQYIKKPAGNFSDCCYRCRFPYLSDTQLLILIGYKNGFNAQALARVLHISHKTVFSHVHKVKENFHLRGSYDFHSFLQNDLQCYKPINIKK